MIISGEVARAVSDQWRQARLDRRASTEAAGVVADGLTEAEVAMKDKASEARVLATQVDTTIKVVSTLASAAAAGASAGSGPGGGGGPGAGPDAAELAAPKTELAAELGAQPPSSSPEPGALGGEAQPEASAEGRAGSIAKNLVKEGVEKVGETFGHLADQAAEPLERQGELRRRAQACEAEAADPRVEQEIAEALRAYVEERSRARLGA